MTYFSVYALLFTPLPCREKINLFSSGSEHPLIQNLQNSCQSFPRLPFHSSLGALPSIHRFPPDALTSKMNVVSSVIMDVEDTHLIDRLVDDAVIREDGFPSRFEDDIGFECFKEKLRFIGKDGKEESIWVLMKLVRVASKKSWSKKRFLNKLACKQSVSEYLEVAREEIREIEERIFGGSATVDSGLGSPLAPLSDEEHKLGEDTGLAPRAILSSSPISSLVSIPKKQPSLSYATSRTISAERLRDALLLPLDLFLPSILTKTPKTSAHPLAVAVRSTASSASSLFTLGSDSSSPTLNHFTPCSTGESFRSSSSE